MAMDGAEGIGISFYGHQIFLFQFSLKIIDENQRCMLSDLKNPNFVPLSTEIGSERTDFRYGAYFIFTM